VQSRPTRLPDPNPLSVAAAHVLPDPPQPVCVERRCRARQGQPASGLPPDVRFVGGLPGRAPPVSPVGRRRRREGRSSQPTSHQPNASPVLGFEDLDEIGSGASGRVYRARQQRMNREVALKVLDAAPDDRDARRRFERELEITVRLGSHPHIVQVLDAGQATDGRPYLAMELFERGSAGDWLARHGPFTQADAIRAGAAIADALAAAHRAGVLHRDVKPENILLSEYGPALSDFGIARPADQLDRTSSFSQFTPWHAAPEVLLDHPPTETADVYSLASTLFTLLDGRPPFAGPPGETLLAFQRRVLSEPPRSLPATVDPELAEVLEAALARDPDQRIATAAGLRDQLRALGAMGYPSSIPPAEAGAVRTDGNVGAEAVGFAPRVPQPIDEVPELGSTALRGRPPPPGTAEAPPPPPPPPGPGSPPGGTSGAGPPTSGPLGDRGDLTLTRAAGTQPDPVEVASDALVARSRWPFVVGGVLFLLVVAVVVAMVVSGGDDKEAAPKRTTSTVVTIPDAPQGQAGKPEDLKVDDGGTSAQLSWTDTTDGGGTPVVLVVPEGGTVDPHEVEQGIGSFLVEDLDPDLGYCFVVQMLVRAEGAGFVKIDSEPACIRGASHEGGLDASTTSTGPTTTTVPATTTTGGA